MKIHQEIGAIILRALLAVVALNAESSVLKDGYRIMNIHANRIRLEIRFTLADMAFYIHPQQEKTAFSKYKRISTIHLPIL